MRRRLLLILAGLAVVLLGVGAAALVLATREPAEGRLETAPTGVTVVRPAPPPAPPKPKPRPKPK